MRRIWLAELALTALACSASAQEPPQVSRSPQVSRWNLAGISSPMWESHPAIDPLTGDLWFVRSDRHFAGWRILMARCSQGQWSEPQPMPIAGKGLEADPWFSADGRTVWFISTRATGAMSGSALDIWRAQRDAKGAWSAPERLPAPVNSDAAEWFPRPAPDGWLYFGSRRTGGFGNDDIWRARQGPDGSWQVENAGPEFNTAAGEYEFQPSADGRWGVLATDKGLYRFVASPTGWRRAEKFGPQINVNGTEIGPMITPDGRGFIYSRDTGHEMSGEFFVVELDSSKHAASLSECHGKNSIKE